MMKKNAMYVGWEEFELSDSKDEQNETAHLETVKNICFIANEDEIISDIHELLTYKEFEDAYLVLEKNLES